MHASTDAHFVEGRTTKVIAAAVAVSTASQQCTRVAKNIKSVSSVTYSRSCGVPAGAERAFIHASVLRDTARVNQAT